MVIGAPTGQAAGLVLRDAVTSHCSSAMAWELAKGTLRVLANHHPWH